MNKLQETMKKYGEYVFRLGVTHLFNTGIEQMRAIDIEDSVRICMKETAESAIMTPEFRANVLRCAYDLSQVPLWDILKFIQTDISIDNTTVHAGVSVCFCSEKTAEEICCYVLPAETTKFDIEEIEEEIESLRAEHKEANNGSERAFNVRNAIMTVLRNKGIEAKLFAYDHTLFV